MRSIFLFAFIATTFASATMADESIVKRLEDAGVRIRAERVDSDGATKMPVGILLPGDLTLTEQIDLNLRNLISTLDSTPTLYICKPNILGHEKLDQLKRDFPTLTVKQIAGTFLGVQCNPGLVKCKVAGVVSGSPADTSGLKKGDTIIQVNERKITNYESLAKAIKEFLPEEFVEVHVIRESKELEIKVMLTALASLPNAETKPDSAQELPN